MRRCAVLAVLLAAGALAGPSGQRTEHRCAAYCLTAEPSKFSYTPGQTYHYSFRSAVRTDLSGASDETSSLEVTARAEIDANSACDLTLRLRDVTLKESDPTDVEARSTVDGMDVFKEELERHPLSFSYQDGRVEELCATQSESVWALNFKRGLLSSIVNNMVSLEREEYEKYEMDVSGYCSTDYTILPTDDNSTLILRSKDLRTCRERGRLITSLQTTPYHSASKVQSPPLLESRQQCWQTVSGGRIRSAFCTEDHTFQPFSRGPAGARSSVTLELAETDVMPMQSRSGEGALTARGNIMFDHSAPTLTARSRVGDAQRLVSELDRLSAEDVRPETPQLFSQLVGTLRHVGPDDLRALLIDETGRPRRHLLDALPMLGTAAGMEVMQSLMLDGSVATDQSDRWMTSLALVQEPQLAMVEAVAPLVTSENVRSQTLLGVTALVRHFCKRDSDCARHEVVTQIVMSIEKLLGTNCGAETYEERTRVLASLKALGNVGLLVQGSTILSACYKNQADIEIRLAAIRAYRRMSCETIAGSGLMSTLANQREDTEVRIAAYLAVMQCPNQDVVDKLLELLTKENINQVGSFIWTHITNMQETNDPGKGHIKSLLHNAELAKKFNTDARKFSRYYEKTLFFESVNAGGTVEGNLIFSPDSYIPRSAMLNLTVELFGDSINLLEVGGRVEGLEKYIENLLENEGSYPQTALNKVLNTIRGSDSSSDINKLSNIYNQANGHTDVFRASTYAKIFGNELHFASYENLDDFIRSVQGDDPLGFFKALGRERDWTENYKFLDSSYTVPTLAGFPLTLHAVGSASVAMKTGGTFSFEGWNKMNAEGYIKPSAAVEIVGGMGVDAHVARTGLKMTTNLHTSSVLDARAVVDSGKLVSVKINMPRDKVEIFDLKTEFHRVFRNRDQGLSIGKNLNSVMLRSYGDCTHPYIGDPLGIKACFLMSYPSSETSQAIPTFPLAGPIKASLTIEKTDPSIEALSLEYTHSNQDGVRQSSLTFDTPGGNQNRRVSLTYILDIPQKALHVGLISPIKSVELSGDLHLTGADKHANMQLRLDDREVFAIRGSLATDDSAKVVRYRPKLVIRGTGGPVFSLTGSMNVNKDKHKYAVDLVITELYENPVTLTGTVDENDGTYTLSSSMDSYLLKGSVTGALRYVGSELDFRSNTRYSIFDGPQHTIVINTKFSQEMQGNQETYTATIDTKFSAMPVLDSELSLRLSRAAGQLGGQLVLRREQHEYQLSAELADQREHRSGFMAFQAVHLDVNFKVALELDTSRKQRFAMTTLAQLNEHRFARGGLVVDYLSEIYDYNYGISSYITLMNSNYSLSTGVKRNATISDLTFIASRSSPADSKIISLVSQLAASESGEHTLEVTLRLPAYPTTRLSGRLAAGVGGRYLVSGEVRRGTRVYVASAEYRYTGQHELQLEALLPDKKYSGVLAARTEGSNYKFKVDLRLGRRIISVFSLRPGAEETNANFELFWNKDVDDTENIILDFRKTSVQIESRLRYPGRDIKFLAELRPRGAQVVLQLSPDQIISVTGTVSVEDDGRLGVTLDVETPFPGYTRMMLTYKNRPDTTDERSLLNFQVVGHIEDQEVVLDGRLVVNFNGLHGTGRERGNTFKAELDLTTPFTGWERSQLVCNYFQDTNDLSARLSASKNDDVFALGLVFEKLQAQEVFRIYTAVDFALPVSRVRVGKVGFGLTLKESHLVSDTAVEWSGEKTNRLSMNVQCRYTVAPDLLVNTHVTFKTPFENMERLDAHLHLSKTDLNLATSFRVLRKETEELLGTYLGSTRDASSGLFSGQFDFACAGCPGFGAAVDYKSAVDASSFNITSHWKQQKSELVGTAKTLEDGGEEYSLALLLPNPNRRYFLKNAFRADMGQKTLWNYWEVSRDDQTVKIDLSSQWTIEERAGNSALYSVRSVGNLTSPFLGWESATISHLGTLITSDSMVDMASEMRLQKEDKFISVSESGQFHSWTYWIYRLEITGNAGWFSKVSELIKLDWQSSPKQAVWRTIWDGQTAQLTLVDDLSDDGDYDILATAQWFGQPERRLSLKMPASPTAWTPSLTVVYAPDKTVKVYGSIAYLSAAAESHVTIETPFTHTLVLKTSHKFRGDKMYVVAELLYGDDKYELRANVDASFPLEASSTLKFSSPSKFLGSGSIRIDYHLTDSLVLNGELSHNDRQVSLTSKFGKREGSVVIRTPFAGFTELSLTYELTPKAIQLRFSHEQSISTVVFSDESDPDTLKYAARLTTPYRDFELLTMTFVRPRGKPFSISFHQNRQRKALLTGSYELSGPRSHVQIEIQTAYDAFRNARFEFGYSLPKPQVKLLITKVGDIEHTMKFEASANLSVVSSTVKADYQNSGLIFRPRSITMTATYDVEDFEKRLDMQMLDGDKAFSVQGKAQLSETSSYLTINIDSPIPDYETLSFSGKAVSLPGGPKLTFELVKNNQTVEADFEINIGKWNGRAVFEMTTPFTTNRHVLLSAEYRLQDNQARFKLMAEKDSVTKTITGSVELSYAERETCQKTSLMVDPNDSRRLPCSEVAVDASLNTPFHSLQQFIVKGAASIVNNACQAQLILDHDGDQVTTDAYGRFSWSRSEISVRITTPLASAQTLGMNATYDIGSQTKTASVFLSKNDERLKWLTSGTVGSGAASGYMTILTPFVDWKSVNYSAMYDLNQAEKQMDISYERNGRKRTFATRGSYDASSISLNAVTPFEGFESLGIGGRYVNDRVKREVGYDAHINEDRHRLYVLYERDGKNNLKLRLNTPIHGLHAVEIDMRTQRYSDGLGFYMDTNIDGKRSSTQIRTSVAKTTMGVDVDFQSDWEGFEKERLSGSVNLAKRKKAFKLTSESQKRKIELSGFYALNKKGGIGKLVSKLPFPGLEKVNAKVRVLTGKKNRLLLTYSAGGKKKKINGDLTFTDNGLNINLKTPFNGFQRIRASVGRTARADGKVSAALSLNRNNREIAVKYEYMFSMNSGDGSIEISTPYEGFEDMRMSLTYNSHASNRNVKFKARRNSREWSIETSKSWADGTYESSLILSSPIESIRSLKVHRSFDVKNLAAMTYRASYERNNRKFAISGEGSILKDGQQVTLEVNVDTPLEIGQLSANVAYDFSTAPSSLKAGITAGPKFMGLEASLRRSSGTIKLTTSLAEMPTIDVTYTTRITDSNKDVSATLTLADGRRLSVVYEMARRHEHLDGSIKVESSTFGNRELSWSFTSERYRHGPVRFAVGVDYKAPEVRGNFEASLAQVSSYLHRNLNASFSIASQPLTKSIELDSTVDLNKFPEIDAAAALSVDGKQYKLVVKRTKERGKRILNISFDGQKIEALRITGTSTAKLRELEGERSYTLTYGKGKRQTSITGKFNLGSSGKSGSLEVHVKKPTGGRTGNKETSLKTTWSFVRPSQRIHADLSVDGRTYLAEMTGSRREKSADYALELSFPSIRVSRRKSISDAVVGISYDFNDGVHVKVQMDKPLEGKAEISFKKSRSETVFKTLLALNDNKNISPRIDEHWLEINYKRTQSATGSKLETSLDTTAFNLGKIEVNAIIQRTSTKSTISMDYKRGRKSAQVSAEIVRSQGSGSSTFRLTSPIVGFEDVSLSGSYQYSPGQMYALNIDYSRAGKHLRLDATSSVSIKKAKGKVKTANSETRVTLSSLITRPIELSFTADVGIKDLGTPKQSTNGKLEGTLNGKKVGLTYKVDRDEHGRRIASAVLTTPLRGPYKKIVVNTDVSLHSNRAEVSFKAGPKMASAEVSWFAGEAGRYGGELSLSTPFAALKNLELEVRGTLNRDRSVDVLGHYQRNGVMVHVTGNVRPYAADLLVEVGESKYRFEGGVEVSPADRLYSVRALLTSLGRDTAIGGEVTVKASAINDLQLTVDVQTPLPAWRRFNVDVAYTSTNSPFSRVIRIAFESPRTGRVEGSLELTNRSGANKTDLRAGATVIFRSFGLTFWTHIFRDRSGFKYEMELEPPYAINLPLLTANH